MRRAHFAGFLILGFIATLAPSAFPSDGVKIVDVGLQGYYNVEQPTIVRVMIVHEDSQPVEVELRVIVHGRIGGGIDRADTFTKKVKLGPNDHQLVGVPAIFFAAAEPKLEVQVASADGKIVGQDAAPVRWSVEQNLVALLCADPAVCQEMQSQIMFSGTQEEQAAKGKALKFASVQNPPPEWLGFMPARTTVVAAPIATLPPAQQFALEGFARQGGTLIVIEDRAGKSDFLAAYRTAESWNVPIAVGRGRVFWIPSLESKDLGAMYSSGNLSRVIAGLVPTGFVRTELDWTRSRLATHFRFPSLTWLLLWLSAYILIAGAGNFIVLRLMDRREWGWVTLPCLAVAFAFAMYFSSARSRPHQFLAEDVSFHWMDDSSPVAAVEYGERVSAPRAQTIELSMTEEAVFTGDRNRTGFRISLNPFEEDSSDQSLSHWDVDIGPPVRVNLRMLQWSFRDLEFRGFERRPGTVHIISPGQLRNDTGLNFTQAILVTKPTVYLLGPIVAGAEVDLSSAKQAALDRIVGNQMAAGMGFPTELAETNTNEILQADAQQGVQQNQAGTDTGVDLRSYSDLREVSKRPFDLTELIRAWPPHGGHVFDSRAGVFFGLADEPEPPGSIPGTDFRTKGYSVTVVSIGRKP